MPLNCFTRFVSGAYVTNTVRGQRASSTQSAEVAAQRLGAKLYGPSFEAAQRVQTSAGDHKEVWSLHSDAEATAYCWQSGRIEIGDKVPEGAIAFATGPRRALTELVEVRARHGKGASDGVLLVPGVPEASDPTAAVDALIAWTEWCSKTNGRASNHQVVFSRSVVAEAA